MKLTTILETNCISRITINAAHSRNLARTCCNKEKSCPNFCLFLYFYLTFFLSYKHFKTKFPWIKDNFFSSLTLSRDQTLRSFNIKYNICLFAHTFSRVMWPTYYSICIGIMHTKAQKTISLRLNWWNCYDAQYLFLTLQF